MNEPVASPHDHANAPRVLRENGVAALVARIVEPAIEGLGFRLVRVKISNQDGCTVQIMAERADGTFAIADCEMVSKDISPLLDVDDPVKVAYHLEVSSPGIDRPLMRVVDFMRAQGHVARIELARPVDTGTGEGRRRYRGTIIAALDEAVDLEIDAPGGALNVRLPYDAMDEARLVLSDALLAAEQDRLKALRQSTASDDEPAQPLNDMNDNNTNAGDSA